MAEGGGYHSDSSLRSSSTSSQADHRPSSSRYGTEILEKVYGEKKVIVFGETGVGKSSLVNAVFLASKGDIKAKVARGLQSCPHGFVESHRTKSVIQKCGSRIIESNFIIYDTRGFADSNFKDEKLFEKYFESISIDEVDVIYICHRMSARFTDSSARFARLLSRRFGKKDAKVWSKCILVLTQANLFDQGDDDSEDEADEGRVLQDKRSQRMKETMAQYSMMFGEVLIKCGVLELIVESIPVCATGVKKNLELPITKNWIEDLLQVTIEKCYGEEAEVIRQIELSKQKFIKERQILGGLIGVTVGGIALPILGVPVGLTIGMLIGKHCAEKSIEKIRVWYAFKASNPKKKEKL
uniref:AIG1-type G domain-containing protein n=1 Tax=Amphimedon queenslandica TaxID=400682 RepID=A0A1X7TL63_AMPQE